MSNKLKNRHLQMIALGGAIGTGLFFGLAKSIPFTGPSILLSYLLGGIIMYIIMRALGEMVVYEPNSGAFSYYATKYVNQYLGFLSGYYAWFEYTIVCMLEVTAVTMFLDLWFPTLPHYIIVAVILAVFLLINLMHVNLFGEFEFWFSGIKVTTIILMIIFALYLIFIDHNISKNVMVNINDHIKHNFFAGGMQGFLFSLVMVVFSFGGTQFVGIAAADAVDPNRTVPKAINGIILRIVIFYIGTIAVILCLYPWRLLSTDVSPFVDVFQKIGLGTAATIMNIIAITAALSAFNSCLYAASRILKSLANSGLAPNKLGVVNKHGVPKNAVIFTSIVIAITIIINYLFPHKAIIYLIAIATTSIIVTWSTILICHIAFRLKVNNQTYKLPLFPILNIIALIILIAVIIIMTKMPDMQLAVYLMPVWIICLTIAYIIKQKFYTKKITKI